MLSLVLQVMVGIFWGVTNVLMKFSETTFQFIVFLLLNQCGSVIFFVGLQKFNLSSAVAVANAVSLAVSAFTGHCLFKEKLGSRGLTGLFLICVGVAILTG
ncbi:hypothetical protein FGIG_11023 [Fasciola gigantica]|uniref:Transmembrane protein n=1 Tax=Fasciola gigantica TaxID=46835 RepID=A0A504ZD58_FASGI|nr:hypothetical protein FGIG_11023 [Fasciola gigantica]